MMKKRLLLVLLAFCMVFATLPVSLAETTETEPDFTVDETIVDSTEMDSEDVPDPKLETVVESTTDAEVETIVPLVAPTIPEYTGTEENPHPITNKWELASIGNDEFGRAYPLDGNYIQTQDIVFTEEDFKSGGDFYNGGKGWKPIGVSYTSRFTGQYNGGGYAIQNIYINRPTENFIGIFGVGLAGTTVIRNLGNENGTITGNIVAGIIAAEIKTVENCYNTSKISGGNSNDGGAAGIVKQFGKKGESIQNCYNTGNISGNSAAGIVWYIGENQKVANCYNTGAITAAGVPAGITQGMNNGTILDCYNTGKINATGTTGDASGIVASGTGMNTIERCFNTGEVHGSWMSSGIAGYFTGAAKITDCFNYGKITGGGHWSGGIGGTLGLDSIVTNCYNRGVILNNTTGAASFVPLTGGISGGITHGNAERITTIQNSYNAEKVSGLNKTGNITSQKTRSSVLQNNYFDREASGLTYAYQANDNFAASTSGTRTTAQMTGLSALANMVGMNSDDAFIPYEFGYPELKVFAESDDPVVRYWSRKSVHVIGDFVDPNEPEVPDEPEEEEVIVWKEWNDTQIGTGNNQIEYSGDWTYVNEDRWNNFKWDEHYTNTAGDNFTIRFDGTGVRWYGVKADDLAVAAVYLDGEFIQYVDCYSADRLEQELLFDSGELAEGEHELKVELTNYRHQYSTGQYMTIDKFAVETKEVRPITPDVVEVNDSHTGTGWNQINYLGNWESITGIDDCYEGDLHRSNDVGAAFEMKFYGKQVDWYGMLNIGGGTANVYLDGELYTRFDSYYPEDYVTLICQIVADDVGVHTLRIEVTGETEPQATDCFVTIDKLVVRK